MQDWCEICKDLDVIMGRWWVAAGGFGGCAFAPPAAAALTAIAAAQLRRDLTVNVCFTPPVYITCCVHHNTC